jgi:aspartate carbamoyltransferase catalytic subunit
MHAHPSHAPAPVRAGALSSPPGRHLLGLEGLPRTELLELLEAADAFRHRMDAEPGEVTGELRGITVCNAFFESSTRTRVSFELAERRLGATAVSFAAVESSTAKGETLLDTLRVIEAMRVNLIVVRHPFSGAASFVARHLEAGVINAGDGRHEHPTQGLLDLLTLKRRWSGRFEGRRVAIVGDLAHSRVARSAIHGLRTLGASVVVAGPPTLVPPGTGALGVTVAPTVDDAVAGADAVMALRLQHERMDQGLLASVSEYARAWGLDRRRVATLAPGGLVMHPGPLNRGVEIASDVADGPRSAILEQVANGVAVRCAVLARCAAALKEAA